MAKAVALAVLLALASLPADPPADELPKGQIIDKVICQSTPTQSYSLFLPSRYDAGRSWPVLFCFDPGARGRLPVGLFQEAAERYGYILAGSNNSRNGAAGQGPESMRAIWNDTQARFRIDNNRVYAAGMSGAARLVCGFGLAGSPFSGIIAFAAGFPGAQAPKRMPCLFFGAAGVDDFNYPEMRQLDREFEKLGARRRIVSFEGGHGWPPAAICTQAIEWLELQSIKAGKRQRDDALLDRIFEKSTAAIQLAKADANVGLEYLMTKALAEDFAGLRDVATFEAQAERLGASREVKKFLRGESEQQAVQYKRQDELMTLWTEPDQSNLFPAPVPSFASMLRDLKKQSQAASDSPQRRVARRVLNGCYVSAYEESQRLLEQNNYAASARMLEMAVSIFPDRPQVLYSLACVYAKAGDRKRTLDALRRASEQGFRDIAAVDTNGAFEFLRNDPQMTRILGEIRKRQ